MGTVGPAFLINGVYYWAHLSKKTILIFFAGLWGQSSNLVTIWDVHFFFQSEYEIYIYVSWKNMDPIQIVLLSESEKVSSPIFLFSKSPGVYFNNLIGRV